MQKINWPDLTEILHKAGIIKILEYYILLPRIIVKAYCSFNFFPPFQDGGYVYEVITVKSYHFNNKY